MKGSAANRILLTGALLWLLPGCYQIMKSVDVPLASRVSGLGERASDHGDVLRELGPPSKMTALPGGFAFLYEYLETTERQIGYTLGLPVEQFAAEISIPLARLSAARGEGEVQTLLVEFDDRGEIVDISFTRSTQDLGFGFGLTPPVITRDLVVAGVSHRQRPNRWGMSLLRHLQYTLNANQDLDAGVHGLEQNRTPSKIGQRTLEWADQTKTKRKAD